MFKIFLLCKKYFMYMLHRVILFILLSLIVAGISMVYPYISGRFIDALLHADGWNQSIYYVLIFFVVSIVNITVGYILDKNHIMLQSILSYNLNSDIIRHVQKLPNSFLSKQNMSYLSQRTSVDSSAVISFCLSVMSQFTNNIILIMFTVYVIISLSPLVIIVMLVSAVSYLIGYMSYQNILYNANFAAKEAQSVFFSKIYEQVSSIEFVRMQGIVDSFISRLEGAFKDLFPKLLFLQKANYSYTAYGRLIYVISQIALMIICGIQIIDGELTVGEFTIILSYFSISINAVKYFFTLGQKTQENIVAYERLTELLEKEAVAYGFNELVNIDSIEMKAVDFSYNDSDILRYDFKFEKGKIYGIVGANGAGKSTMIKLLVGMFIGEYSGEILYNDVPINALKIDRLLQRNIGVSEQEPYLFEETLRYNIMLSDDCAVDKDKLLVLVSLLSLESFLPELSDEFNSSLCKDISILSGGEKQKVSLLRVLIKNPDVIILDEPTSALDERGRENLFNYLDVIKSEKIIIVVTHDCKLLGHFDEIIELSERGM